MNKDDLIIRIRALISALEAEKSYLDENSRKFQNYSRAISDWSMQLDKITGNIPATSREVSNLQAQFNKLFTTLKTGSNLEVSIGGKKYGTKQFAQVPYVQTINKFNGMIGDKEEEAVREVNSSTSNVNQNKRAKEKIYTQEQLKKMEERAARIMEQRINAKLRAIRNQIRLNKLEEEEQRRAEGVKARRNLGSSLPGGQNAFNRLNETAQRVDPQFTPDRIKSVFTEPMSGISKVNYEMQTAEGIFKRTTFTVDKFGNVLADTQKRFRSFGDAIMRDTGEFLKWSIAAALVLGPLQKLSELVGIMIQNESALADITITLGNSQRDLNEIFNAAAEIADKTAESLDGVLEAYNQAYRATGDMADADERFATANDLLEQSITLSKLSTLDQSEAIDILSASLKQLNMPLTEGETLLNKWVAVSKVANVDLETLATTFSVVADSAGSAGIDIDRLNTIVAALAESTGKTPKEAANSIKALLGSFQSDQVIKEIDDLGVSAKNAAGDLKQPLEIIREINERRNKGYITAPQFNQFTNAFGPRRQGDISALMNAFRDTDKTNKVMATSLKATKDTGEAQAALANKLDTVASSVTRLGNAFQALAQSLGESGGMLDIIQGIVQGLTSLVQLLTEVTNLAGKAAPVLAVTLGTLAVLNTGHRGERLGLNIFSKFSRMGAGFERFTNPGADLGYRGINVDSAGKFQRVPMMSAAEGTGLKWGGFASKAAPYIGAGIAPALAAIENLTSGNKQEAIGNAVGGAIGLGLGAAVAGPIGATIGATLGSAIAEGLVKAIKESGKFTAEGLGAGIVPPEDTTPKGEKTPEQVDKDIDTQLQKYRDELLKKAGYTNADVFIQKNSLNALGALSGNPNRLTNEDVTMRLLSQSVGNGSGQISQQELDKLWAMIGEAKTTTPETIQKERDQEIQNKYQNFIDKAIAKEKPTLLYDYTQKRMNSNQYKTGSKALADFGSPFSGYYDLFGEDYTKRYGTQQSFFDTGAKVSARATTEELAQLETYQEDVLQANQDLLLLDKTSKEYTATVERKNLAVQMFNDYLMELNTNILGQTHLLDSVDFSAYSQKEFDAIEERGNKFWDAFLEAQGIAKEQMEAIKKTAEETLVLTSEGYTDKTKVPSQFQKLAEDQLKQEGKLKTKDIGFQQFDLSASEFDKYIGLTGDSKMYTDMLNKLTAAGYKEDRTDSIGVMNDGFVQPMKKDWKIVQYLLGEILKTEQKQLDGMYNLPEGASFWIPYQASKYGLNSGTTTPGTGGVGTGTTTTTTTKTEEELKKIREKETYPNQWDKREANQEYLDNMRGTGIKNLIPPSDQMRRFREADNLSMLQAQSMQLKELSTKLSINLTSTINLKIDGKQLTQAIKKDLVNDIVNYGRNNAVTSTYVVGQ